MQFPQPDHICHASRPSPSQQPSSGLQFNLSSAERPRTAQNTPDMTPPRPTEGNKCFPPAPGYPQASMQWAIITTNTSLGMRVTRTLSPFHRAAPQPVLLRSFWTAAVSSKVPIWCHLQVWWVYSIPSSRWLMKFGPNIGSREQLQNNWLPVSIWTLDCYPLNQTAQTVFHLHLPCSPVWATWMVRETVSKA